MAYTGLQNFYNQTYASDIAKNPTDYNYNNLSDGGRAGLVRQALGTLEDNKVYALGDTNGLEGYQNQFLKQGNQFIPIQGDASQYGTTTQLDFGTQHLLQNGYGVRPLSYAIKGGQSQDQSNQAYNAALNDSTTPRINGQGQTISGQQALADQSTYRNSLTDTTSQPGYQPNAQDAANKAAMLKGVPVGLANAPTTQPKFASSYTGGSIVDFLGSVKQDSSFANRAKLAAANGITGYTGTAAQNTQLLSTLRGATSPTPAAAPPAVPGGITTDSFKTASSTTVPGAVGDVGAGNANALVAGGNASIAQITAQLTPPETPEAQQKQSLLNQMASLTGEEGQKAADQLTAEQSAGIPQLKQQFSDINGRILTKSAEYNALQADQEGKPVTMNSIIGATRQILNAKAADIGLLTAQSQALQGQITTAQDTANRAIDLKFSTIAAQHDTLQAQLNALQPTLDAQDKVHAEAVQIYLDNQKQALADTKQTAKDIAAVATDAITKGGLTDTKLISQIQNAKTLTQAQTLAAPYLAKQGQLDNQLKQAELNKTKAEAAKAWADTSANTPVTPPTDKNSQSILSQTGISSTVFNYITQGTSALTRMTAAQRTQVQKDADAFLNKNGLDYSTFKSRYTAYNDVLQKNLERSNNTSIFAGEVSGTVDQFIKDFKPSDVSNGFFGLGSNKLSAQNVLDLAAGKEVNNPLATKYSFDIQTMANDLAGYFAASRGANSPENTDLADAAKIISSGINTGSADAFKQSITDNETKVTGVVNKAVESANKNVWKLFGVDQNYDVSHQGVALPQTTAANTSTAGSTYSGITLPHQ